MMKLKTAVVGAGFIGTAHIKGHKAAGNTELVGLVDVNEALGRDVAKEHGVPFYPSLDALLAQAPDIQMIDVCVPTWLHERYVASAARAGKHVLCEKPITFALESFHNMRSATEAAGVKFMVAQAIRFWPEYVRVIKLKEEDAFGQVHMIHARRLCETPNWSAWYADPEKSGGALYDLMLHDLDFVQYFAGDIDSVFATGAQNASGCWNHVQANIRFKSGTSAVVETCNQAYGHYPFTMGLQVFGEDMIADYALTAGHNIDELGTRALYTYTPGSQPVKQDVAETDAYTGEIQYFADCILKDADVRRMSVDSAETTLKLVLAVKRSLETGQCVAF